MWLVGPGYMNFFEEFVVCFVMRKDLMHIWCCKYFKMKMIEIRFARFSFSTNLDCCNFGDFFWTLQRGITPHLIFFLNTSVIIWISSPCISWISVPGYTKESCLSLHYYVMISFGFCYGTSITS